LTEQEHPLEFLPELALGVLAEADAPGIRDHLAGCETCRAEYEAMLDAARLLPFAVEQVEPSPAIRESLMERIASEPTVLRPRVSQPSRPAWQRFAAIAAAVAVLVVAGGVAGAVLNNSDSSGLEAEVQQQGRLVQAVARGEAARGTAEQNGATAMLVYAPGTDAAFAVLEGLPALPEGKAYQAWFIDGAVPRSAGVFSQTDQGIWLDSDGDVGRFAAMALTIEDRKGAAAPTQDPFVVVDMRQASGSRQPISSTDWAAITTR